MGEAPKRRLPVAAVHVGAGGGGAHPHQALGWQCRQHRPSKKSSVLYLNASRTAGVAALRNYQRGAHCSTTMLAHYVLSHSVVSPCAMCSLTPEAIMRDGVESKYNE